MSFLEIALAHAPEICQKGLTIFKSKGRPPLIPESFKYGKLSPQDPFIRYFYIAYLITETASGFELSEVVSER